MKSASIKHYSKALITVGKQQGVFDQLIADLLDVSRKIDENLDFKKYLNNSHIDLESKKKAINTVFEDFISDRTKNFIMILIKNKKLNYLDQIISVAQRGSLKQDDVNEVIVESVIPLTVDQEKQLQVILSEKLNQKILLRNLINKSIIGGLLLKVDDTIVDGSLRGKFENLKKKINTIE